MSFDKNSGHDLAFVSSLRNDAEASRPHLAVKSTWSESEMSRTGDRVIGKLMDFIWTQTVHKVQYALILAMES